MTAFVSALPRGLGPSTWSRDSDCRHTIFKSLTTQLIPPATFSATFTIAWQPLTTPPIHSISCEHCHLIFTLLTPSTARSAPCPLLPPSQVLPFPTTPTHPAQSILLPALPPLGPLPAAPPPISCRINLMCAKGERGVSIPFSRASLPVSLLSLSSPLLFHSVLWSRSSHTVILSVFLVFSLRTSRISPSTYHVPPSESRARQRKALSPQFTTCAHSESLPLLSSFLN